MDTTGIPVREREADWQLRQRHRSIFYADNLAERLAAGEAMPSAPGIQSAGGRDIGDGRGVAWVERGDIAISGGACRGLRRVFRLSGGSSDWNVKPWGYAPRDVARTRRDGSAFPVVSTALDPAITARSKYNARQLPVINYWFGQVAFRAERGMLWEKPWYWLSNEAMAEYGARGARPGLHKNKLMFWTGGQSPDQFAVTWDHASEALDVLFYEGNSSTSSWEPLRKGFIEPDQWIVVEVHMSTLRQGFINDDKARRSTLDGDPVFVAVWAAPYGEPPMLLGYTSHDGRPGPGWIPSRLNDDRNPIMKWQDANGDDYAQLGARVVGPESGGSAPQRGAFSIAKYAPAHARRLGNPQGATTQRYYKPQMNQHFNPGRMPNWGAGVPLGFSSGALAGAEFVPRHPLLNRAMTTDELRSYKQAVIRSTRWAGSYAELPDGTRAEVHFVTLEEPLPIAPDVGDCLVVGSRMQRGLGVERDLPGFPETRMYYDELLLGTDEIPFPHQQGVALPMPWLHR